MTKSQKALKDAPLYSPFLCLLVAIPHDAELSNSMSINYVSKLLRLVHHDFFGFTPKSCPFAKEPGDTWFLPKVSYSKPVILSEGIGLIQKAENEIHSRGFEMLPECNAASCDMSRQMTME